MIQLCNGDEYFLSIEKKFSLFIVIIITVINIIISIIVIVAIIIVIIQLWIGTAGEIFCEQ
jgi:hypothetical protein